MKECICCDNVEGKTQERCEWIEIEKNRWCCCKTCAEIAKSDLDAVE